MKKKSGMNDTSKILMIITIAFVVFCGYIIARKKILIRESTQLPYHEIEMSQVEDGTYYGKTYTSFLHLQVEVDVLNHQIVDIRVLEKEGLDGEKAFPIIKQMISSNNTVVPVIKGAELGSIAYISCVNEALYNKTFAESSEK